MNEEQTPLRLSAQHRLDLARSGLSETTIRAAGLRSLSAAEVVLLMGRDDAGSGLAIPYPNCAFSDGRPYVRIRLDAPLVFDEHSVRYLTKKGERNRLYVPPTLSPSVLSDPSASLGLTE